MAPSEELLDEPALRGWLRRMSSALDLESMRFHRFEKVAACDAIACARMPWTRFALGLLRIRMISSASFTRFETFPPYLPSERGCAAKPVHANLREALLQRPDLRGRGNPAWLLSPPAQRRAHRCQPRLTRVLPCLEHGALVLVGGSSR
eukprot:scaffold1474_cov256-Pinguiococcus_pyrenoidosus.AAC.21